jgi:hypothetical protein
MQLLSARDFVAHPIGTFDREYQRRRLAFQDSRDKNFELTFRAPGIAPDWRGTSRAGFAAA